VSWSDASAARVEHTILGPASGCLFERKMSSSSSFWGLLFLILFKKRSLVIKKKTLVYFLFIKLL